VKMIDHFKTFMAGEVNLNKSRIDDLTCRVETISKFIVNSDWGPVIHRFSPQGSWAHKTIIKPFGTGGFDADLVIFVSPVRGWSAKEYVLELRRVFKESKFYEDKVSLRTRCVVLDYANDFHIDLVPCLIDRLGGSKFEVCNRREDTFEATNSEAYSEWFNTRNDWTGDNRLREVIRLLKYLRDIKSTFTCKSILLTTLVGERVTVADNAYRATYFPDLPTALKSLVGRLDDYLQGRPDLHKITNPVLPTEDFIRHWDNDKYSNFRELIHKYKIWIDEAYAERDPAESIVKWQRLFGDEFGKGAEVEVAKSAERALIPLAEAQSGLRDAVDWVKVAGAQALARVRTSLPWVKPTPWRMATTNRLEVIIRATQFGSRSDRQATEVVQSGYPLPKRQELLFEARTSTGLPLSGNDFTVQWRVVNTDQDAYRAKALRGGFYRSDRPGCRWESTLYRGVHWVEAFVIRKRDGTCIGQTAPFFVVIE
jgi:hypothetical protein